MYRRGRKQEITQVSYRGRLAPRSRRPYKFIYIVDSDDLARQDSHALIIKYMKRSSDEYGFGGTGWLRCTSYIGQSAGIAVGLESCIFYRFLPPPPLEQLYNCSNCTITASRRSLQIK